MRIRKHSTAVLSSPTARSTPAGDEMMKEREYLLPLVAAIMDVQAKAEAELEGEAATQLQIPETGNCTRPHPGHNWRNVLLQCTAKREAQPVGRECQKANYRWNGIASSSTSNPEDKCELLSSEACVKEDKSSNFEHEISEVYRKRELPKSGRSRKALMWREKKHDLGVKKKRHAPRFDAIENVNAGRKDATIVCKESVQTYKPKPDKKVDSANNSNNHAGSQCKRRNGRGWRCSERTLVGYSLCEHHLGKGRFKSLNGSHGPGAAPLVNNKGNKFKELHLIQAASCNVEFP